jgi:flagellar biosynthesis component FlhA
MSASLKSVSRSFKNVGNVFRNDNLTNFVLFLTIALSVGYLVNKTYHAIVVLYVIAALMFLLCKNVACALGISIILTNLFLSLKIIDVKENFEDKKKESKKSDKKEEKEEKKEKKGKKEKKE